MVSSVLLDIFEGGGGERKARQEVSELIALGVRRDNAHRAPTVLGSTVILRSI